jgi:hypothetical protein
MMIHLKRVNWKNVAEFVGITAIVGSLIFVGLQMRQEQSIAIVDTYGSVVEGNGVALTLISAHPEIWQKGLEGDELSTADEIVFAGMVRAVMGHYLHMSIRFARIGPFDPELLMRELAYAIYIFPGLRRQLEADDGFRNHRDAALDFQAQTDGFFLRQIAQQLSDLDEQQPKIPDEKQYIFWYF